MYLFDLASRHMTWLGGRQAVTAANIANADTPGYRAKAITDFDSVLGQTGLGLSVTAPGHLPLHGETITAIELRPGESWDQAHSGNTVSIESELMKAGQTSRMMSLDTGIARSFHRMLLSSLKA